MPFVGWKRSFPGCKWCDGSETKLGKKTVCMSWHVRADGFRDGKYKNVHLPLEFRLGFQRLSQTATTTTATNSDFKFVISRFGQQSCDSTSNLEMEKGNLFQFEFVRHVCAVFGYFINICSGLNDSHLENKRSFSTCDWPSWIVQSGLQWDSLLTSMVVRSTFRLGMIYWFEHRTRYRYRHLSRSLRVTANARSATRYYL